MKQTFSENEKIVIFLSSRLKTKKSEFSNFTPFPFHRTNGIHMGSISYTKKADIRSDMYSAVGKIKVNSNYIRLVERIEIFLAIKLKFLHPKNIYYLQSTFISKISNQAIHIDDTWHQKSWQVVFSKCDFRDL